MRSAMRQNTTASLRYYVLAVKSHGNGGYRHVKALRGGDSLAADGRRGYGKLDYVQTVQERRRLNRANCL